MPQFLLSVIHPYRAAEVPSELPPEMAEVFAAVEAFNERLRTDGHWVFAGGLTPIDDARVARTADGSVTDGPYAETEEHLGGFWVVECREDEVEKVALRAAEACRNDIEIRPFQGE